MPETRLQDVGHQDPAGGNPALNAASMEKRRWGDGNDDEGAAHRGRLEGQLKRNEAFSADELPL